MSPEEAVAAAHADFAHAAEHGDEPDWDRTFETLAAALGRFDDTDDAVLTLERLVDAELESLRRRWAGPEVLLPAPVTVVDAYASRVALLYLALVEDFYAAVDLVFDTARTRIRRVRLLIEQGRDSEAESLLRLTLDDGEDLPVEVFGGEVHGLLAILCHEQQPARAYELFTESVRRCRAAEDDDGAAQMLQLRAGVLEALGRLEESARDHEEAAEVWSGLEVAADEEQERDEAVEAARQCAAGLYLDLAHAAMDADDRAAWERFARRARDLSPATEAENVGVAALLLGWALLQADDVSGRAPSPQEALDVLTAAEGPVAALDTDAELLRLTMVALAHTLCSDPAAADDAARRATALARRVGRGALLDLLQSLVLLWGTVRGDITAEPDLAPRMAEEVARWLRSRRLRRGLWRRVVDDDEAALVELVAAADDPSDPDDLPDPTPLLARLGAEVCGDLPGDPHATLQRLEESFAVIRAVGPGGLWERLVPMLETARALVVIDDGQQEAGETAIQQVVDRQLAGGQRGLALRLLAMLGEVQARRGDRQAAVARLLPAALAAATELTRLPSAAERAAQRMSADLLAGVAVRAVAETGDVVLMAELVETLRCQGLPAPLGPHAKIRSAAALLSDLGDDGPQPWAEQETALAVPPRVVLPWGAVALGRHYDAALPYAPALATAARVRLVVPR